MPTQERRRLALEQLVANSSNTRDAPSSFDVSQYGVTPSGNGSSIVMNAEFQDRFLGLVQNEFLSRGQFIQRWMDPRRDYYRECGYPESSTLTNDQWQEYYDRHPIAARVIELMPNECWQETPDIIEDEDDAVTTPFEQAFRDLAKSLQGEESYFEPSEKETHPLWEICRRADIASRIGQFGLILIGVDDGLSLNQPVEGWEEEQGTNITWNQEGVDLLLNRVLDESELSPEEISKYISLNEDGTLTWNIATVVQEDEEEDELGQKKKKK